MKHKSVKKAEREIVSLDLSYRISLAAGCGRKTAIECSFSDFSYYPPTKCSSYLIYLAWNQY